MKRTTRLLIACTPVLAVAALWAAGNSPAEATAEAPAPLAPAVLPVTVLEAREADTYEVATRYAGRVVSRRTSELGFDRSGRLISIEVDEGDRVETGQRLAGLDVRELEARRHELDAQVDAAQARVTEIEARLALAKVTTQRRRQLLERDTISAQLFDESRYAEQGVAASLAAAQADIAAAKSARHSIDVALDLSTLAAPYAGSIVARLADEGSVVSPGQRILTLVEDGVLEVRVGLPPEVARSLEPGTEHAIEIDGRMHPAKLHALLDTVETDTRTVTALFRFAERPMGVLDGELARVAVVTQTPTRGFWLPITALTESRRGLWSAYVVEEANGRLTVGRRELEVIHAESDRVFVRGTLRGGERVVATGLHRLVPGQQVRLNTDPIGKRVRLDSDPTAPSALN
ncbi:MAG: efflux RND transporter periplasmic adaptor subunit [Deltaproteobacteria bacterium]|nr:efflux RND transporter periplasmic adaptor subunit [Deltaproteobacteria bacterium]MBW2447311.1 efflux RND transporter periplasmic adaptor subunit [Deltaproteobacteria bacterium]